LQQHALDELSKTMLLFHDFKEQIYANSPVQKLKQNIKGELSTDAKSNVHRPQYSGILKKKLCASSRVCSQKMKERKACRF